jgi:formylglycine-generating enzyme required for sulfatase activity
MALGSTFPTVGITQSGSSGSYTYSVAGSDPQAANCPIFDVTWGDAARFCNWLEHWQPTGAEGIDTTETGAYTLNGATSNSALMVVTRNARATYFIPTQDEWYKAAYYKGGGTNAAYWLFPTQSNTAPSNVLSASGTNNANFNNYNSTTQANNFTDPTNYLTPVGAFVGSPGPYGTYDMGGDVFQLNETLLCNGFLRGMRGGAWTDASFDLASYGEGVDGSPPYEFSYLGFRVAASAPPRAR